MLTRVLPEEPVCLCCFCITSLLFPPTVNGQHHKGMSYPKPVMWSRTRMGKMSRPHFPVFCQPTLTRISPCWCLYPSFRYLCPFKRFKPICSPACHVLDSMLVFFLPPQASADANASWCGCCCGHCCDVTMPCSVPWMLALSGISNNDHWVYNFFNLFVCGYQTCLGIGARYFDAPRYLKIFF